MFVQDGEDMSLWEEDGEGDREHAGWGDEPNQGIEGKEVAHLSLNSLAGINSPRTMNVKGNIRRREVVVLIDGGATHNFIDEDSVASHQ